MNNLNKNTIKINKNLKFYYTNPKIYLMGMKIKYMNNY